MIGRIKKATKRKRPVAMPKPRTYGLNGRKERMPRWFRRHMRRLTEMLEGGRFDLYHVLRVGVPSPGTAEKLKTMKLS